MKTFYTERDITDMHTNGVTAIEVDDDVVLTDLARDKAIALGMQMKLVDKRSGQPNSLPRLAVAPQMQLPPAVVGPAAEPNLVAQIKSAVIAKLGTTAHNDLLDQVIPQVLARLRQ